MVYEIERQRITLTCKLIEEYLFKTHLASYMKLKNKTFFVDL